MKILAAKILLVLFLFLVPGSAYSGGIPVIDGANLSQNVMNTIETILQTLKQIEEYKTQLDQYQRQLDDALNFDPADFLWDEADKTISDMLGLVGTVSTIKGMVEDVNFYKNTIHDGLTISEIDAIYDRVKSSIETENQSIDELIDTVDDQQARIGEDATKLIKLQEKAELAGDVGQLQALQSANMLASHMGNQLLQIRGMLVAQSNIEAAHRLKLNDQEARDAAVLNEMTKGEFHKSEKSAF